MISEDDQFHHLEEKIGPRKGGRPQYLPPVTVNNRLLLQLNLLKKRGHTWTPVRQLFDSICVHNLSPVPPFDVEPLLRAAVKEVQQTQNTPSALAEFLSCDKNIAWVGPFSKKYNVTKSFLLSATNTCTKLNSIPVGILLELDKFRKRQGLDKNKLSFWILTLCSDIEGISPASLLKLVKSLRTELKSKQIQRKKMEDGEAIIQAVLDFPAQLISSQNQLSNHLFLSCRHVTIQC